MRSADESMETLVHIYVCEREMMGAACVSVCGLLSEWINVAIAIEIVFDGIGNVDRSIDGTPISLIAHTPTHHTPRSIKPRVGSSWALEDPS